MTASRAAAQPGLERRWIILQGGAPRVRGHAVHVAAWQAKDPEGSDAPPVVLVHGLGGSHLNWLALAPNLMAAESPPPIAWAPDLGGFGHTAPLPDGASIPANRDLLVSFIETVSPEQGVLLVGNSMGGLLALLVAADRPDLVAGMVLISPAVPLLAKIAPDPVVAAQFAVLMVPGLGKSQLRRQRSRLTPAQQVEQGFELVGVPKGTVEESHMRENIRMAEEMRAYPHVTDAFLQAARSTVAHMGLRRRAVWRAVDRVRAPTLLIAGTEDRLVRLAQAQRLIERRPDWDHRLYDGHGHVVMIAAPERVATDIGDWFDGRAAHPGA